MTTPQPTEDHLMAQITLDLNPLQQEMLLDALNSEVSKWLQVRTDIVLEKRPNGSFEGATMLIEDATAIRDQVKAVVRNY